MLPNKIFLLSMCFLAFFGTFKEVSLHNNQPRWGNRDSFMLALITQGTILVLLTEGLSAFHLFQRQYLLIGWVFVLIITLFLFGYLRVSRKGINLSLFNLSDWGIPCFRFSRIVMICLGLVGFQFIVLAMVAYVYAPNNWDSMTYHLSRVMHWQQNQSVAPYVTNIERQVQSQPFAEYEIANLQILLKNDRYDNFVQLFAFFVCFVGITNITKKLRGSFDQQILAGVVSATIPMAILQSTSTQTDLVLSEWLVCFVLMGINLNQEPKNRFWLIGTGLSLGLACLTKATALIFALPFCIWFGIFFVKGGLKNVIKGLLIAVLVLVINFGFLMRNYLLFSNPLGTGIMFQTANQIHTFGALSSNVIRNIALNFSDIQNPVFRGILSLLQLFHEFTGFTNTDPKISLYSKDIFEGFAQISTLHEDFAGNPIHTIINFLTVCLLFYVYKKSKMHPDVMFLGLNLVFSFLLFSYYLKFQLSGNRLLLPLFVLWAPVNILILWEVDERIAKFCIVGILLCSFYWTFGNSTRGINQDALSETKNREQVYFVNDPSQYLGYAEISDSIKSSDCLAIGLDISEDTSEYPLWVMLADRNWRGRIEHVNVSNPTSAMEDKKFMPCAIVSDNTDGQKNLLQFEKSKIKYFYLPPIKYIFP
jgi:hypothetical protein